MADKKSFVVYKDWDNFFKLLSDDQLGIIFRAIFNYALFDKEPRFEDVGMVWVFSILKGHLDRDKEKYNVACEKNRINALKRWSDKTNKITENTTEYQKCHSHKSDAKNADNDNDNVNENVNDNDKENVNVNVNEKENDILLSSSFSAKTDGGYSDAFLEFWAEYPKKVGKAEAYNKYKRLKLSKADNSDILSALKWQKNSSQWQRDGGRYIPNPSTYLSQRRWEDEPDGLIIGDITDPDRYDDGDELPDFIMKGDY